MELDRLIKIAKEETTIDLTEWGVESSTGLTRVEIAPRNPDFGKFGIYGSYLKGNKWQRTYARSIQEVREKLAEIGLKLLPNGQHDEDGFMRSYFSIVRRENGT